ncbi:MAG: hypothetical protein ABSD62_12115 [Candidatus Limnocylindrales bacterium]
MSYAERTVVSPEKSRAEIERILSRYGAQGFMYGWDNGRAVIAFRAQARMVRFYLPLLDADDRKFTTLANGYSARSKTAATAAYEQEVRRRWRALALTIKAKLETIESGIATFEEEFLAHLMLPNGETVAEWMAPQVEAAYLSGQMPATLPGLPAPVEKKAPRITARVVEAS